MTRREFLKTIGKLTLAGAAVYLSGIFRVFQDRRSRRPMHTAKFYKQADHLAG